MWEWKPTYELNLHRLHKGRKLLLLALKSGTLRDTPTEKDARSATKGALTLLDFAIKTQEDYKAEHPTF